MGTPVRNLHVGRVASPETPHLRHCFNPEAYDIQLHRANGTQKPVRNLQFLWKWTVHFAPIEKNTLPLK